MCFTVLAWKCHKDFPLLLGFNRDEFLALEAAPAAIWEDRFVAGKHLPNSSNPGTWMGMSRDGRFAALTNVRDFSAYQSGKQSRGEIVRNYLRGTDIPSDYLRTLSSQASCFNPFNFLVGSPEGLHFFSNHPQAENLEVLPGIHGFSNGKFNEPWPKVERGKAILKRIVNAPPGNWVQSTLDLLADTYQPDDADLPDTKVGNGLERLCAPIFMKQVDVKDVLEIAYKRKLPPEIDHTYGTRTSTVLLVDGSGKARLVEETFSRGKVVNRVDLLFPH